VTNWLFDNRLFQYPRETSTARNDAEKSTPSTLAVKYESKRHRRHVSGVRWL